MTASRRSLFAIALVCTAGIGVVLAPAPVEACVWRTGHYGNPFPPCPAEDNVLVKRINQLNVQLVGKVTTVASNIMYVRQEVEQWKDTWRQAKGWVDQFRRHYSQLTTNPLPSLIAAYNRNAPLAAYLQLSDNGNWAVSLEPVDLREIAEQFLEDLHDEVKVNERFFRGLSVELTGAADSEFARFRDGAIRRTTQMAAYERYIDILSDSLNATGTDLASRYTDWTDGAGLSEAKISRLSAMLSRLRGTSVAAETRGMEARAQAIESAIERGDRLRDLELQGRLGVW